MNFIDDDDHAAILDFIEELFEASFEGNLQSIVFDAVSINHGTINNYFISKSEVAYLYYIFREEEILSPYYPFLNCIREHFQGFSKEETLEVLKKLNVYKLHIQLFMSYIYNEPIKREPEVLRDEIYFEQLVLFKSIVKLLDYVSTFKDMVLYLGNLHLANESTIKLIEYMIYNSPSLNILILMTFDTECLDYEEDNQSYEQFIEKVEELDLLVRIESNFYDDEHLLERKILDNNEVLKLLEENYHFLAIEDCISYGKKLYVGLNNEMNNGDDENFLLLLKMLSKSFFLSKDSDSALFYDNMALTIGIEADKKKAICETKIRLGYNYSIRNEYNIARKYAQDAYDEAKIHGFTRLEYQCLFLFFIIDKECLFVDAHSNEEYLDALIDKSKVLGYDNYLAMIYTNPRELYDNFTSLKEERFNIGVEIAKEIGNEHQLGVAYHNQGIIYSRTGENGLAFEFYLKSQKIKEKIGDKRRVAFIYNSLGYHYSVTEQYQLAHEQYMKSFRAACESRDYHEVCMTLYNMASNAFFYGKYTIVCDYLNKLVHLMKVSKTVTLKYHSKKMIYDLYIISLIKTDNYSKAKNLYNKCNIWGLKAIVGKTEECFMNEMMEYSICQSDGDREEALIKAEEYISKEVGNMWHFRKYYYLEKIQFYKEQGSNYYKKVGKIFAGELDAESIHTKIRMDLLVDNEALLNLEEPTSSWVNIDTKYKEILYTAKIDQNMLKLKNRINEISFLNLVQNMLANEENSKNVYLRLQQLIHGNTKVEKSFCRLIRTKGQSKLNLKNAKLVINEVYADRILGYVMDKSKPSLVHIGNSNILTLKKVYGYSSVMYLPIYVKGKRKAEFIFMTQKADVKLNQDDLGIFTLVARLVGETIERLENAKALKSMNLKLQHLSNTDLLTGLFNRNALENKLQSVKKEVNEGLIKDLTILFIDLDNFKYYNDCFGHSIGDQVLIYFADILKEVIDEPDFAARFGGDEFVILIQDRSEADVMTMVDEIYLKLEEKHYFERVVGRILGKRISVPKENRLSCSIGMASMNDNLDGDVEDLLKLSDQALYEAKGQGKNQLKKISKKDI